MKKKKPLLSVETNERRYKPFVVRLLIELVAFGVPFVISSIFIPVRTIWRIIVVIFLVAMIVSVFFFICRCINVSDNKAKDRVYREKYKEKFEPVSISKEDFVFWLKNADLNETIVIKSIFSKYSILELFVYKGKIEFCLNGKDIDSVSSLIAILEEEEYLNETIIVCETFDHNKPEFLLKVIDDLKGKINTLRQ